MDDELMAMMGIRGFGVKKNVRQLDKNRFDKNKRVEVKSST
jgi:hypothetical protein